MDYLDLTLKESSCIYPLAMHQFSVSFLLYISLQFYKLLWRIVGHPFLGKLKKMPVDEIMRMFPYRDTISLCDTESHPYI